jgi:hypothetical protein
VIRATAALTVVVAAPFASPAAAPFPKQSIPAVRSEVFHCEVTANQLTANCRGAHDLHGFAVLKDVSVHPVHLADATPGATVEVIVRRDPGKRADGTSSAEPLDWAPPPPPGAPPPIVDPNWRLLPPDNLLKEFYPDRAFRMGIIGDATATCGVGPAGDLVGCWVASENPADQGFGWALLKITTCLQIDAVTKSGLPSPGGTIKVGAHFTLARGGAFAVQLVLLTA